MGCQPVTILKQITPPLQKIDITFDRPSGSNSTQWYSQTLKGNPKTHTWALVTPSEPGYNIIYCYTYLDGT